MIRAVYTEEYEPGPEIFGSFKTRLGRRVRVMRVDGSAEVNFGLWQDQVKPVFDRSSQRVFWIDGRRLWTGGVDGAGPTMLASPADELVAAGVQVVYQTTEGRFAAVPAAGGAAVLVEGPAAALTVSPDRRWVLYGVSDQLRFVDTESGISRHLGAQQNVARPQGTPDGRYVAWQDDGKFFGARVPGGPIVSLGEGLADRGLIFSPGSRAFLPTDPPWSIPYVPDQIVIWNVIELATGKRTPFASGDAVWIDDTRIVVHQRPWGSFLTSVPRAP